jgi:uncharacterized protein RF_0076
MRKKFLICLIVLLCAINISYAEELVKQQSKYPDYSYIYLGHDKYEKINRKVFNFNLGLNKYAIRPVHILWCSIIPEYGIERIHSAYKNIEYPKRLISSLIQKDFKSSGTETVRFLTNTTLGIGGMFDPAKKFFNLEPVNEDMEQALTKCKCNSGSYLVLPVMNGTTARGIAGKILDTSLNPTTYVGTPVLAMVKAGLTVNRTSYMQPFIKMIESTYADPYEIARKMYGIDNYIKCNNLDRKEILENGFKTIEKEPKTELVENTLDMRGKHENNNENDEKLTVAEIIKGGTNIDNIILKSYNLDNSKLMADMLLYDYNPQNPVVDSMRTALFDMPEVDASIWNELSIWNRCFSKKIKTSSVNITPEKENYKFKYIMQKDKNSPVAIIYPSIGEGITSRHSVILAKIFYDAGYSVIIQGSHFQWEFVKCMPDSYKPGIPSQDAEYLKTVTSKIVENLEHTYNCKFREKTVIGTSFGALTTLFLANQEFQNNTLNITKYISICPPIELVYAMQQVDKNSEEWDKNPDEIKNKAAVTAAKVIQLSDMKNSDNDIKISSLPFTEDEGKLITGFIMHQKLSDLIFTLEKTPKNKKTEIYNTINNMNYRDYTEKYLLGDKYKTLEDLQKASSLLSLEEFLKNSTNYKIYHTLDDYLVNQKQLKQLKIYTGKKTVLLSNGAHLGFLYKPEFIEDLKREITIKPKTASNMN